MTTFVIKRYRVNVDLYLEAGDTTQVEHVMLGMADCYDYNRVYFAQRGDIVEISEDDE